MVRAAALASVLSLGAITDAVADPAIRVDAGVTGATVGSTGRNGGGMVVEVKGYANDMLSIGGRVEFAMMFGGTVGDDERPLDFAMVACGILKAEYYVIPGPLRPFVSLGAGAYTIGSQSIESGPSTAGFRSDTGNYFGIAPQIGVDVGRLRLAATYNAILGASLEFQETVGGTLRANSVSQNYLSLELSFRFGGGPKRTAPQPQPQPYPPAYPPTAYPPTAYPPTGEPPPAPNGYPQPAYPPPPQGGYPPPAPPAAPSTTPTTTTPGATPPS